jgi:hypothetical protein
LERLYDLYFELSNEDRLSILEVLEERPTRLTGLSGELWGARADVDTVMVDGEIVKEEGEITVADVGEALSEAQALSDEICGNLFRDRPDLRKLVKG